MYIAGPRVVVYCDYIGLWIDISDGLHHALSGYVVRETRKWLQAGNVFAAVFYEFYHLTR